MSLINCKIELSLNWIENCVLTLAAVDANVNNTGAGSLTFKITDANLYVAAVTLSVKDNAKLSKLLSKGFRRTAFWNEYKVIDNKVVEIADNNEEKYICLILVSKELKDCLFLLIIIKKVIIKLLLILIKTIFFQELK